MTGSAGYRRVGHREKTPRLLRRPRSRGWKANPWFSMHGWRRFLGRGPRIRPVNVRKRGRASWRRLDSAPCLLGAEGDDVEVVHGVLPTAGGEASVRALVGAAAADDLAGDSTIADVTEQRRDAERAGLQRDLALADEADAREPPGSIRRLADHIQLPGSGAARVEQRGCDGESVAWRDPSRSLPGELCKRPNIQELECARALLLGERERDRVRHVRGGGAGPGDQGERPDRECHGRHHREALHGYLLVCCSESAAQLRVRTKLPLWDDLNLEVAPASCCAVAGTPARGGRAAA